MHAVCSRSPHIVLHSLIYKCNIMVLLAILATTCLVHI